VTDRPGRATKHGGPDVGELVAKVTGKRPAKQKNCDK
jgi:hypothetical protein